MTLILDGDGNAPGSTPGDLIKDSDYDGFPADVLQASTKVPVIVDFWAPWCGPCKQLTPLLEKLVTQMGGAVKLVKINVDENQELAAQFRVQTVPTVFGVVDGRPVDGFGGALPESQVKAFIQKLTKGQSNPIDEALEHAASALEAGDADTAEQIYTQVLGQDQTNVTALAGVLKVYVAQGKEDQARDLLSRLPPDLAEKPEIAAMAAAFELLDQAADESELEPLRIRLAANENDHAARFDLATAFFAGGQAENAIAELLVIMSKDRDWNEGAAKTQLLKIFEALGPSDPIAQSGRRRMSSILFA